MNRRAERIKRTHPSTGSYDAFKGRELRSFRPFPASAEPSPLEHRFGEVALMPPTSGPAGRAIQARRFAGSPGGRSDYAGRELRNDGASAEGREALSRPTRSIVN